MNKIVLKIKEFFLKSYLTIYMITIIFAMLFYIVLKGATGHKFVISNEEKIYSLLLLLAFVLSGFYKERKRFFKIFNKVIVYMLLPFSIITFGMSLYFLYFTFTFDYGFWENAIMITSIFFILPIIFTWCNFYLIKNLIKELRK